jgi:tRNA pseudouridine55 synthase
MQRPPKFSAIKIQGKRAFEYARSDEEVALKERLVHIEDFKLDTTNFPTVNFEVKCSKGTYIRSLVNDFGKALNSGACMTSLRRTKIGEFSVENARDLMELKKEIIDEAEKLTSDNQ